MNNSIVSLEDIGEEDDALLCYTNSDACCENNLRSSSTREWYFPNRTTVSIDHAKGNFYRNRALSLVRLNRRNNATMPTGVYHCEIPDANETIQSVFVGIYPDNEGAPTINDSLVYNYDDNQRVECTSSGGPATVVTWWKNGRSLDARSDQYQIIINEKSSKYQNILLLGQQPPGDIVGSYSCHVENSRGEDNKSIQLKGEL